MIDLTLLQSSPTPLIVLIIFFLIIVLYVIGHRLKRRAVRNNSKQLPADLGAINGTLLGLLGLLLAFAFSMASARFDSRRQLTIEEANDIGTVILRTDIYPDSVRKVLRSNLKEYVDERIAFYEAGMDMDKVAAHYLKADSIGKVIWSVVAAYTKTDNITTRTSELIPALNAMIDITNTRRSAGESTVPDAIMYFLFTLCFGVAFLLGYDNKGEKIDWIGLIGLAVMLSITVYMIIDLDRPRSGLINTHKSNEKMIELREMF